MVAVAPGLGGNVKPAKKKSTERIDGIVAQIMAIGCAMLPQEPRSPLRRSSWDSKKAAAPLASA